MQGLANRLDHLLAYHHHEMEIDLRRIHHSHRHHERQLRDHLVMSSNNGQRPKPRPRSLEPLQRHRRNLRVSSLRRHSESSTSLRSSRHG